MVRSGAGMANAAAATALAIERYSPERIYNAGVCGVYADGQDLLGTAAAGTAAVFADAGVASHAAFLSLEALHLPLAQTNRRAAVFNIITLSDNGVPREIARSTFLTVAAASGDARWAEQLKSRFAVDSTQLICEDMESAAVGLLALKASIPCTVVRGISNQCGERDYGKWKLTEAARAAQQVLLRCLED